MRGFIAERLRGNKATLLFLVLVLFVTTPLLNVTNIAFGTDKAAATRPVVVLLSDTEDAYRTPVATFKNELDRPVKIFNLFGDIRKDPDLIEKIYAVKPALIFTLGAKASYAAKIWSKVRPDIPVVFAMVINWEKYNLLEGINNMAGIASEVAPGTQFANLLLFVPGMRKLGVIYSEEHSGEIVAEARREAEVLGVELVTDAISRPRDFERAYKRLSSKVDGIWIVNDPVIYTLENITWLEQRCIKDRRVCIGQSENVAKSGVLLAVNPNGADIGTQAAYIAKNIIDNNQRPDKIGVLDPIGTSLILNKKTADKIGLTINGAAMDMATKIIE